MNHLDLTRSQLKLIAEGKIGELRVGFLGSASNQVLPDLLAKLNANQPLISTSLEELSNSVQVEMIEKDKLDLGFVRLASVPNDLEMKVVLRDTFSLVVPINHPIHESDFTSVNQFKHESFVLFPQIIAISITSRLSAFVVMQDFHLGSDISQFTH